MEDPEAGRHARQQRDLVSILVLLVQNLSDLGAHELVSPEGHLPDRPIHGAHQGIPPVRLLLQRHAVSRTSPALRRPCHDRRLTPRVLPQQFRLRSRERHDLAPVELDESLGDVARGKRQRGAQVVTPLAARSPERG